MLSIKIKKSCNQCYTKNNRKGDIARKSFKLEHELQGCGMYIVYIYRMKLE